MPSFVAIFLTIAVTCIVVGVIMGSKLAYNDGYVSVDWWRIFLISGKVSFSAFWVAACIITCLFLCWIGGLAIGFYSALAFKGA